MKKLLGAICVLMAAANASAQLVYEPFNYAPASNLDNQTNPGNGLVWSKMSSSPGTDDNILLANPASNLPISGLSPASGNSVAYGGTGASEQLGLGQDFSSGTLYYSLAFDVTSALTTTPAFIAGFSNVSGTSITQPQHVGTRLYLRQGSTANTFNIGVSKNSSALNDISFDTTDFALNTPVLVVGSYKINGTTLGTDDQSTLYINPASSSFGAAAAPTVSTPSSPILVAPLAGTDLPSTDGTTSDLAGFVLRQASATVPGVQVDELRVDQTWAQVTPPIGITWNVNADGLWSEDAKWSTGARPNNGTAFVNFNATAVQSHTIDVDSSYAVSTLNFGGSTTYLLNGAGTLNFAGGGAINDMAGNQTISAAINLGGDLLASVRSGSTLTVNGTVTSNGNSLNKAGAGTLALANARFNQLNIIGGKVKILPNQTVAAVSKVSALNISNSMVAGVTTYNASLDLTNNDLVIDYVAGQSPIGMWNGSEYTGILGAIQSGRNGGAWNGLGIITSQSAASSSAHLTTLGVAEASAALGLSGTATDNWRGQTVDASSLLIKYTYTGDANLDGRIDADDYFAIDSNYNKSGSVFGYSSGDFNYDGKINGDDYFLIDSSFVAQSGLPPAAPLELAAVPEPMGAGLAFVALAGSLRRRRRRC